MGLTPNVVPDAPILSAWGNEVRDRSIQVFATAAERSGAWPTPPQGAHSYLTATKSTYLYDGAQWVWTGGVPLGARLSMSGSVSIPSAAGWTAAWDTVSWNNGMTTTTGSSAGITVIESGVYMVTTNVIWNYNGATAVSRVDLAVDGTPAGSACATMSGTGTLGLGVTIANQYQLSAGNKVTAIVAQGSGNSAPVRSDSHLAVVRQ